MIILNKLLNLIIRFKSLIEDNEKFISSLSSLVVITTGLLISIYQTSIYKTQEFLLKEQTEIQKQQTEIQKQQTLPHFSVYTYYGKRDKNSEKYTELNLNVDNNGGDFYSINSSVATFLRLDYKGKSVLMPTNSFFGISGGTGKKNGTVYSFEGSNNNLQRSKLLFDLLDISRKNNYEYGLDCEAKIFVKIEYQDIYKNTSVQYFDGATGELLNEKVGISYFEKHSQYIKNVNIKLFSELKINDLLEYLENHSKSSGATGEW